ncbi:4-hydroxy-tetrahydrodipicolinate synthase [hydrothermal vent metagenome]|uniref:4-hydroxy-tetrahydrodipicolinate synthase n=1 Tax=hydrothermal vent metagenome TaxID=652676 RepID=A0A3B1BJR3_9ZZZZ
MFSGSHVAIVTPFKDGKVDEEAYKSLIEWHIEQGTNGIITCGTTGESPTLSHAEHNRVIELCVKTVNKRVPVMAGTGSNSTVEAISLTEHAANVGADAALLVNPYYNKPTQEGIYLHYKAIAEAVSIPQFIYNIPGRTASQVSTDTITRLAEIENIAGVKDAVGDLAVTTEIISRCGDDLIILSGDDTLTLPMMALGAKGVISTTANVAPAKMAKLVKLATAGDFEAAKRVHYEMADLMRVLFIETNPIPVKAALAMMGKVTEEIRLPLCPISQMSREKLQSVMKQMELI